MAVYLSFCNLALRIGEYSVNLKQWICELEKTTDNKTNYL